MLGCAVELEEDVSSDQMPPALSEEGLEAPAELQERELTEEDFALAEEDVPPSEVSTSESEGTFRAVEQAVGKNCKHNKIYIKNHRYRDGKYYIVDFKRVKYESLTDDKIYGEELGNRFTHYGDTASWSDENLNEARGDRLGRWKVYYTYDWECISGTFPNDETRGYRTSLGRCSHYMSSLKYQWVYPDEYNETCSEDKAYHMEIR